MIISPVEKEDLGAVVSLEESNFKNPWTREQYLYELEQNDFSFLFMVKEKEEFLGYIDFWILFDQGTINKICINPDYRNRGIGKIVMTDALKRMHKAGVKSVTLEVRVSNKNAISLYKKLGFKQVIIKKQYYQDGEDAIYMLKELGD